MALALRRRPLEHELVSVVLLTLLTKRLLHHRACVHLRVSFVILSIYRRFSVITMSQSCIDGLAAAVLIIIKERCLAVHDIFIKSLHLCANPSTFRLDPLREQVRLRPLRALKIIHSALKQFLPLLVVASTAFALVKFSRRRADAFTDDAARLGHVVLLDVKDDVVVEAEQVAHE